MKKKVTQILSIALCMVLLFGSTVTANAAKTSSNTSAYQAVFDAEYYYNSNPDECAILCIIVPAHRPETDVFVC